MSKLRRYGLQGSGSGTGTLETFQAVRPGRLKQLIICWTAFSASTFIGGFSLSKNNTLATAFDLGLCDNYIQKPLRAGGSGSQYGELVIECNDPVIVGDIFHLGLLLSSGAIAIDIGVVLVIEESA